jgi:hypothetical protein
VFKRFKQFAPENFSLMLRGNVLENIKDGQKIMVSRATLGTI